MENVCLKHVLQTFLGLGNSHPCEYIEHTSWENKPFSNASCKTT